MATGLMHTQTKPSGEDLTVLSVHRRVKELGMQIIQEGCCLKREGEIDREEEEKKEVHIQTPNPLAFAKMTNAGTEA